MISYGNGDVDMNAIPHTAQYMSSQLSEQACFLVEVAFVCYEWWLWEDITRLLIGW